VLQVSPKSQDLEALAFLEKLRPGGPWVLTAIVPDGTTETITARTPDRVEAFIREHDGTRNLYYSVNPTRRAMSKKTAKTDIAAIEYALADLDPAEGETPRRRPRRRAISSSSRARLSPSPARGSTAATAFNVCGG
jgi:Mesyanzhinovviridae DNA primase